MHTVFKTMDALMEQVSSDKRWTGPRAAQLNRYPLRFVLFESFGDFYEFVGNMINEDVSMWRIETWLPKEQDDLMLTYSSVVEHLRERVKHTPANNYLLATFSEITRFLTQSEFNSLIATIRTIESPAKSQEAAQRIYVPIIGMQKRMGKFFEDQNCIIWEYRQQEEHENYRLVLTPSTYGVRGLEERVSLCRNVKEWLGLWNDAENLHQTIVCTSRAISLCAGNAQPDNAFDYVQCTNAYEFLTQGLQLDCGDVVPTEADLPMWERLANGLDAQHFSLRSSAHDRWGNELHSAQNMAKAWTESNDEFARWLLKQLYILQHRGDYMERVLLRCQGPNIADEVATLAFAEPFDEKTLADRRTIMAHTGQPTQAAENLMAARLKAIATERGHHTAMRYMTATTRSERCLVAEWLGKGHIDRSDVRELMPLLHAYTSPLGISLEPSKQWVEQYFEEYVRCKVANQLSPTLRDMLAQRNATRGAFEEWQSQFSTTKTLLHGRTDIDLIYWVDGMGLDWLPLLRHIIKRQEVNGIYLNEVMVARAELPTRTSNNREHLVSLAGERLQKIGDLDAYAHKHNDWPSSIVDEVELVAEAMRNVLMQYNGKKIAFVSDHGITYMAQHAQALALGNALSDHHGRCAEWQGKTTQSNEYLTLADTHTLCSLTHNSLTANTPKGIGAHGGATPEEVLVPIVVVSAQKNASHCKAELLTPEIMESDPRLVYAISGMSTADVPVVTYNDADYHLTRIDEQRYASERLPLVGTCRWVTLRIGGFTKAERITVKTAAEDSNLFDGL